MMNIGHICTLIGWVLCAVFAVLLLGDFIKTEKSIAKEEKSKKDGGEGE